MIISVIIIGRQFNNHSRRSLNFGRITVWHGPLGKTKFNVFRIFLQITWGP